MVQYTVHPLTKLSQFFQLCVLWMVGRFLRAVDSAGPAPAILDQEPIEIVPEDFARLLDKVQLWTD